MTLFFDLKLKYTGELPPCSHFLLSKGWQSIVKFSNMSKLALLTTFKFRNNKTDIKNILINYF
jgi:hypothetical protein